MDISQPKKTRNEPLIKNSDYGEFATIEVGAHRKNPLNHFQRPTLEYTPANRKSVVTKLDDYIVLSNQKKKDNNNRMNSLSGLSAKAIIKNYSKD